MTTVYLLKKHEVSLGILGVVMSEKYTVEGVYPDRATAQAIAKDKNKRAVWHEWTVQKKEVK